MSEGRPGRSAIEGARFGRLPRFSDGRGWFSEVWRASTTRSSGNWEPTFVQANLSSSAAGVLRGLHLHRRQLDYWVVLSGRVFLALVDIRGPLADPLVPAIVETRELAAGDFTVVPAGVAHGFLALEPVFLLYLVTNEYDGTDELGFAWNDPAVGVPWPRVGSTADGLPILSDRDGSNPSLAKLVAWLRER